MNKITLYWFTIPFIFSMALTGFVGSFYSIPIVGAGLFYFISEYHERFTVWWLGKYMIAGVAGIILGSIAGNAI